MRRRHAAPLAEPLTASPKVAIPNSYTDPVNSIPSASGFSQVSAPSSPKYIPHSYIHPIYLQPSGSHTPDGFHRNQHREKGADDDTTSVFSYADSIPSTLSSKSSATSVTGLSVVTKYSNNEIVTGSKELISIFHDNDTMLPLYKIALTNPAIGPERLQRNLRRLFRACSEHLKDESADRFEYLVAQLVAMKSRGLAEFIVENHRTSPVQSQAINRSNDSDSSDEEAYAALVNEESWVDLGSFRKFLVGSEAFKTLQEQLLTFVLQESPEPLSLDESHDEWGGDVQDRSKMRCEDPLIRKNLRSGAWQCWWQGTLIKTGLLEPPLHPTKIRMRWSSVSDTLPPLL
jgi:hypothetical protein